MDEENREQRNEQSGGDVNTGAPNNDWNQQKVHLGKEPMPDQEQNGYYYNSNPQNGAFYGNTTFQGNEQPGQGTSGAYTDPKGFSNGYSQGMYGGYAPNDNKDRSSITLGVVSLVLGVLSLLCFATCINWVMAIAAIVVGIIQIATKDNKGFAIAGIVTAILSILASIILSICLVANFNSFVDVLDSPYYQEQYRDLYDDIYESFEQEQHHSMKGL